jgi:hypothetical protein
MRSPSCRVCPLPQFFGFLCGACRIKGKYAIVYNALIIIDLKVFLNYEQGLSVYR